jgi:LPXTG-motif cell wall-anchored protein
VPEPATTTTSTTTTTFPDNAVVKSVAKPQATAEHCDTADVSITVVAPQVIATAPSSAAPTTVAAAAELPHTGSSDTPLMLLGGAFVIGGLATAGFARSRRKYSLD